MVYHLQYTLVSASIYEGSTNLATVTGTSVLYLQTSHTYRLAVTASVQRHINSPTLQRVKN
jgi:hypothetical protein